MKFLSTHFSSLCYLHVPVSLKHGQDFYYLNCLWLLSGKKTLNKTTLQKQTQPYHSQIYAFQEMVTSKSMVYSLTEIQYAFLDYLKLNIFHSELWQIAILLMYFVVFS